jgi:hypothetical protein
MLEHQVAFALTDTRHFRLPMTPELQEWTIEHITKELAASRYYRKHAFLMPEEFIAGLAIEQVTQDTNAAAGDTHFFSSLDKAKTWLFA